MCGWYAVSIRQVTKGNGTPSKGVFVSRDKRKDAVPAHIEGYGRIKSYGNRTDQYSTTVTGFTQHPCVVSSKVTGA